ncbi:MAG: F0F1 ATP synthase subunit gamma [Candidatus Margulisbacteria bacterium]|nr:F0F1 ATP synthase subunit gamma [Candidatus Margulisiibacteriota bacterium]
MSDLLTLKQRRNNITAVYEITDAMQIITTIIIGRTQKLLYYRRKVQSYYDRLLFTREIDKKKSRQKSEPWLIVFFAEKGFSGNFNPQILPLFNKNKKTPNIILVGSRGKNYAEKLGVKVKLFCEGANKVPTESITDKIFNLLKENDFPWDVKVIVNKYNNMFVQIPKIVDFFPAHEEVYRNVSAFIDMNNEKLDEFILEKYVRARLFYLFAQNFTGETASKLLMMKNAVENAEKLKEEVSMEMYKARQLKITQELSEIISAYKVLQNMTERR